MMMYFALGLFEENALFQSHMKDPRALCPRVLLSVTQYIVDIHCKVWQVSNICANGKG